MLTLSKPLARSCLFALKSSTFATHQATKTQLKRAALVLAFMLSAGSARAADLGIPTPTPTFSGAPMADPMTDYFAHWQERVREAQESQPHWMTPLVTVTPRLEQEVRFDATSQDLGNGARVENFGNGKGLELIPTTTNEVLLNAPGYLVRSGPGASRGIGDYPFLTVKQRLISANEEHGNYIVTAFFGMQAPIGDPTFTNHAWLFTPTLAAGKGFGDFDVQGTIGVQVPGSHQATIGTAIVSNVTLQYHAFEYLWPEVEFNDTAWSGGVRDGRNQLFMTVGVIFGRFQLPNNVRFIFGGGYQFELEPTRITLEPALVPTFDHGPLLTARLAF